MPGLKLTEDQILLKLRILLRQKYGRINYLGNIIRTSSIGSTDELDIEINNLIQANCGTRLGVMLLTEVENWRSPIEDSPSRIQEPLNLELAMDWNVGEYQSS